LRHEVHEAKVTLQIETKDHTHITVFKAPETERGVYLAKPVFPEPGQWNVSVEVHRNDQVSTRASEYVVPK
jgi:hypothetical protein